MTDKSSLISEAFNNLMTDAPEFAQAWGALVQSLVEASSLDSKTRELAYLSVLASLNRVSGIPFHVTSLKEKGASAIVQRLYSPNLKVNYPRNHMQRL